MSFLSPGGLVPHRPAPPPPRDPGGTDPDSGVRGRWRGIGRGAYPRLRALAVRPGSPDRSRMSGSGGALGGERGDPRAATSTQPPRARPARGPEARRPRAPSRGRGALPRGSAAKDCPARAGGAQNSGPVSESPCPGDLVKPRAGEPRGYWPFLPPPRDCYSGRRAQGRGMCANRGRLAGFRESGSLPPLHGRADRVPTTVPYPVLWPFKVSLLRTPPAGVPILGFPLHVLATPSAGPPAHGGEAQRQGLGVRGGEPTPGRRISGRCCHQRTNPTPPPALPARPPDWERPLWSQTRVQSSQFCMVVPSPSPTSIFPFGASGVP